MAVIKSVKFGITFKEFAERYRKLFPISNAARQKEAMAQEFERLTGRKPEEEKKVKSESFRHEEKFGNRASRRKSKASEGNGDSEIPAGNSVGDSQTGG